MNVYWFKRDLRLHDMPGLVDALSTGKELLLLYIYEPSLWQDKHYSARHSDFVKQSIEDLNKTLYKYNTQIITLESEALPVFEHLIKNYDIDTVYSTMETGIDITYKRDLELKVLFKKNSLKWKEVQSNGVFRGITSRATWSKDWYKYMNTPIEALDFSNYAFARNNALIELEATFKELNLETTGEAFQKGGTTEAKHWLNSFFNHRLKYYSKFISKPLQSRMGCSRLSPYISWGNLSIRQVYQMAKEEKKTSNYKRALNAFNSRLRWQSHFIQKFEQEPRMQFEAINKGYLSLPQPYNEEYVQRWKDGMTGYPLVDASMRAVRDTGYINFRMRCLVTSFLCHHLFQHFTHGSAYLAAQFLDWEPGIHYSQFQMQASLTGTNTVRIYNPTKGAHDHDPEATFIKHYIPELSKLPAQYAIEPWLLEDNNEFKDFTYGKNYPKRIVNITETRKAALSKIYGHRKNPLVQSEKQRILQTHSIIRKKK